MIPAVVDSGYRQFVQTRKRRLVGWSHGEGRKRVMNPCNVITIHPRFTIEHSPTMSRETWVQVNAQLIQEMGAEAYLRELLDILESGEGIDDSVIPEREQAHPAPDTRPAPAQDSSGELGPAELASEGQVDSRRRTGAPVDRWDDVTIPAEIRQMLGGEIIQRARFWIEPCQVKRGQRTVSAYRAVLEGDWWKPGGGPDTTRQVEVFAEGDDWEDRNVFDAMTASEAAQEWLRNELGDALTSLHLIPEYRGKPIWYDHVIKSSIFEWTPMELLASRVVEDVRAVLSDLRRNDPELQLDLSLVEGPHPIEIHKVVNDVVAQRLRFEVGRDVTGPWVATVTIYRDDEPSDLRETEVFGSEGEVRYWILGKASSLFMQFSEEELGGAAIRWECFAYDDAPQDIIDLASFLASAVEDYLQGELEERRLEEKRARGEPITWGIVDDESGAFTPHYTEYPGTEGRPTRFVDIEGNVWYEDEDGSPVDEFGNRLDFDDVDEDEVE